MPTILQINVQSNSGSTGRITEHIGLLVQEKGWSCYLAHGARYAVPSQLQTIQIDTRAEEYLHGLWYSLLLDEHGLGSSRSTRKLVRLIRDEIKPDLIHLHNVHGYYLNYKILFEFLATLSVPVVWTLHDCWTFTGHCVHFDHQGCFKWRDHCENCVQKSTYPRSLFRDHSRANFELKKQLFTSLGDRLTIVTVSHWLEQMVRQSFFKHTQVRTIYNGVDPSVFKPQSTPENTFRMQHQLEGKFIAVACAATWSAKKGFYDFLELAQQLDSDEVIVLVGLPPAYRKQLPANVIGLPKTHNVQELVAIYASSDVVLNLSYEETLGMTSIEGMACGVPTIVYNATASPELVTPATGYIVEKGDVKGVKDQMERIREKGKKAYAEACRARAEQHFNQFEQYKKYIDLYEELLLQTT